MNQEQALPHYLNTELQMLYDDECEEKETTTLIGIFHMDKGGIHYQIKFKDSVMGLYEPKSVKPIFRDMSDLTKEIKDNGETIIPMLELYCIAQGFSNPDKTQFDVRQLTSGGFLGDVWCCSRLLGEHSPCLMYSANRGFYLFKDFGNMDTMVECKSQLELWLKLIEWHFNVFNLDADLWINKNA